MRVHLGWLCLTEDAPENELDIGLLEFRTLKRREENRVDDVSARTQQRGRRVPVARAWSMASRMETKAPESSAVSARGEFESSRRAGSIVEQRFPLVGLEGVRDTLASGRIRKGCSENRVSAEGVAERLYSAEQRCAGCPKRNRRSQREPADDSVS